MAVVDNIYLIKEKHRHNSVKFEYLCVKKIVGDKFVFYVLYCNICRKYLCPAPKYEFEYKGKINDKLFVEPSKDTFILDTSFIAKNLNGICLNNLDSFNVEHLGHNICGRILNYKGEDFELSYCKDCDVYGTNLIYYNNIKNGEKLHNMYVESNVNNLNNLIEFLIRINTFKCNSKKHDIEEIIAIVSVFNIPTNKIEEVEVNAFYCINCNLYYIYDNEYNKILKRGIPICPIHEEIKYFNKNSLFDKFNTESLLRQFGYSVSANEDLSTVERHKIIEMVLDNGIMTKNEILSHLNFLVNSRKNLSNMSKAVSKWNDDISFVNTLKNKEKRVVRIGAFRKIVKNKMKII